MIKRIAAGLVALLLAAQVAAQGFFPWPGPSHSAAASNIAFIASAVGYGDANSATSSGINTTGATLLVAMKVWYSGAAEPSFTDSKSNSWSSDITTTQAGDMSLKIYYSTPSSVGSGHTVSCSGSGVYCSVGLMGFSGTATSSPADSTNYAGDHAGSVNTRSAGNLTPSAPDYLFTYALAFAATDTLTFDPVDTGPGGGIASQTTYSGGNAYRLAISYGIQSGGPTARNPAWSWAGATAVAVIGQVFKKGP